MKGDAATAEDVAVFHHQDSPGTFVSFSNFWTDGRDAGIAAVLGGQDRCVAPMPQATLSPSWSVALTDAIEPEEVLVGAAGIAVRGAGRCELFSADGVRGALIDRVAIAALDRDGSHLVIGGLDGRSMGPGRREKSIEWRRLPDGTITRRVPHFSDETLVGVQTVGGMVLLLSRQRDGTSGAAPDRPGVWVELRMGHEQPDDEEEKIVAVKSFGSTSVLAAVGPKGYVLASEGGVQWTNWKLRLGPAWKRRTQKLLGLAAGPDGVAYLAVVDEERPVLFVVGLERGLMARTELPAEAVEHAPIALVREGGGCIVTPPGHVLATDRAGRTVAHTRRVGRAPGTATSGSGVVVVDGARLLLWRPEGGARSLWAATDPLRTSAVHRDGTWYVATATTLYALQTEG
jgi:hypothetical protein